MKMYAGNMIKSFTAIVGLEDVIGVLRGLGCVVMVAVAGTMGALAGICGMRTCGEVNPVSVDMAAPVFGWQMAVVTNDTVGTYGWFCMKQRR